MSGQSGRVALIEAGSPGLNIYSHVAMGRGIPLLATVLRQHGYEVRAYVEDVSGKGSVDWDWVRGAHVVGFSAITCTLPRTVELLEECRRVNPEAVTVFGGPEPTCDPLRSLSAGADYVLRGEGEHTLPRFIEAVMGSDPSIGQIPGLVWNEHGRIRSGPEPRQLTRTDLDALPLVDRSLVHRSFETSVASVWRTRGCGQLCDFCEVREIWPRHVTRDQELCVRELAEAQHDGYQTAFLIDDNAGADKRVFKDLLRRIADSGFARMLVVQLRADSALKSDGTVDRELLGLLKRAATLTVVCVGVESASDEDLAAVHKRTDSSRMATALKAMRRYGIVVHGMFISFADDTREVIRRNGRYARKYVTSLQYLAETPLPGTKSTERHLSEGAVMFRRTEDLSYYDGMHVVVRPSRMSAFEMQRLMAREYRRFYSIRRVVGAALSGVFVRNRMLSAAQKKYLRGLSRGKRLLWRARFEIEYRFAPVSFLAIGHKRVREMLSDPSYAEYLAELSFVDRDGI